MSLAESIASQLNGRKSGNGWIVRAVCHNPDSRKFNLQISDGDGGKLRATCHSNSCSYKTIMEEFEALGLKPLDTFTPHQRQQQKIYINRKQSIELLNFEMFMATKFNDSRLGDIAKNSDRNFRKLNPQFKQMPDELCERERLALERVHKMTGQRLCQK